MKKGESRRQELLNIAYRMFIRRGYENTSIDEIIAEAGIAKGTYYYYFPSKEATLEAVVDMIVRMEAEAARGVIESPLPVPRKIVAVIASFRPGNGEEEIAEAVEADENIVLHDKLNKRLIAELVPLLSEVVREGIDQKIFKCAQVEERVRMILILSTSLFDDGPFGENDVTAFIDMVEKTLGAKPGTMGFVRQLIMEGDNK